MPHLLFIISKYYVGHFHYVPQQALKSWKEPVHLKKKMENMLQYPFKNTGRTEGSVRDSSLLYKCVEVE